MFVLLISEHKNNLILGAKAGDILRGLLKQFIGS